jgi:hypothetical protein
VVGSSADFSGKESSRQVRSSLSFSSSLRFAHWLSNCMTAHNCEKRKKKCFVVAVVVVAVNEFF